MSLEVDLTKRSADRMELQGQEVQEDGDRMEAITKAKDTVLEAIRSGDLQELKALTEGMAELGFFLNAADRFGNTALLTAARKQHLDIVAMLLTCGANVNQADGTGRTALQSAVFHANRDLCILLVQRGATVPAHLACDLIDLLAHDEYLELVERLLSAGMDLTRPTSRGTSVLLTAVQNHAVQMANTLFTHGAQVNQADCDGTTPLIAAAQSGQTGMVSWLLAQGAAIDQTMKNGCTALMAAAQKGDAEMVRLLLVSKADLSLKTTRDVHLSEDRYLPKGSNALSFALSFGMIELSSELIDYGSMMCADVDGRTPLMSAAMAGALAVVQVLLDKGAKTDKADSSGETALSFAVKSDHFDIAEALIKAGANVNQANNEGTTAVLFAARNGNIGMIELLIGHGGDILHTDAYGRSALMFAANEGHSEAVDLLAAKGLNVNAVTAMQVAAKLLPKYWGFSAGTSALIFAAANDRLDACKRLIAWGASVNIVNEWSADALMGAAYFGHYDICALLLDHGASTSLVAAGGKTALQYAELNNNSELVLLFKRHMDLLPGTTSTSNATLLAAILAGNLNECENLILSVPENERVAFINQEDEKNITALILAVEKGQLEVCDLLVKHGAKIDYLDSNGMTPLRTAAGNGNLAICKLLVAKGAEVNQGNVEGATPLMRAMGDSPDYFQIVEFLVQHGADVNQCKANGWSPLMFASSGGRMDAFQLFMSKGATVTNTNPEGNRALSMAAENGHLSIVSFLADLGESVSSPAKDGYTPLMYAAQNGHLDMVKYLFSKGADVNQSRNDNYSALMSSAATNNCEIVHWLLSNGANVNQSCDSGWTALFAAANKGYCQAAIAVLDHGADVNQCYPSSGWTALMNAAAEGHLDMVRLLLSRGANVNSAKLDGCTALLAASNKGHRDIVTLLLDSGANVNQSMLSSAWTPLMAAVAGNHLEAVRLLVKRGANLNPCRVDNGWTSLLLAADDSFTEVAEFLLDNGASINQTNSAGCSALMLASSKGNTRLVEILMDRGADVNLSNSNGWTALKFAVDDGYLKIADVLMAQGAEINQGGYNGWTALLFACNKGHLKLVEMLLDRGAADLDHFNSCGWSPVYCAAKEGFIKIIRLLLDYGAKVEHMSEYGDSVLRSAIKAGAGEGAIKLLVDRGANVNFICPGGWTAILDAASIANVAILTLIIDAGADVDVINDDGWSALMIATKNGFKDNVRLLCDRGASVNQRSAMRGYSTLMHAAMNNSGEMIELLLTYNASIDMQSHEGLSAVMYAISKRHCAAVKLLLSKGADINQVSATSGKSLLVHAAVLGAMEIVELLLQQGFDIDVKDHNGWTALMHAVSTNQSGIVECLINHKGTVNHTSPDGTSAFNLTTLTGNKRIADLLLAADPSLQVTVTRAQFNQVGPEGGELSRKLKGIYLLQLTFKKILNVDDEPEQNIRDYYIKLQIVLEEKKSFKDIHKVHKVQLVYHISDDERIIVTTYDLPIYDNIVGQKRAIDLEHLFDQLDVHNPKAAKILILGRAGVGKTTLMHYIAYKWGADELWKKSYDAVFRIRLKELTSENWKSNYDKKDIRKCRLACFVHYCTGADELIDLEDVVAVLDNRKDRILFLLDGYDEIAHLVYSADGSDSHDAHKIIAKIFECPNIIMTSRPNALDDNFKSKFDRIVENIGLDSKCIEQYVDNYFRRNPVLGEGLKLFLSQSYMVKSICTTPINAALVCLMWSKDDARNKLDKDMSISRLYQNIVLWLSKRFLANFKAQQDIANIAPKVILQSTDLNCIKKIAYEGLLTGKLMVENGLMVKLITEFNVNIQDINRYGILRPNEDKRDMIHQNHYFLHLTFQEFLTGCFLKDKLASTNLTEVKQTMQFIAMHRYNPQFLMMLKFLACLVMDIKVELMEAGEAEATAGNVQQLTISRFWQCISNPVTEMIEIGCDYKINLYMHLLAAISCNHNGRDDLALLEPIVSFVDENCATAQSMMKWKELLLQSKYMSENIKRKLMIFIRSDNNNARSAAVQILALTADKDREVLDLFLAQLLSKDIGKLVVEELGNIGDRAPLHIKNEIIGVLFQQLDEGKQEKESVLGSLTKIGVSAGDVLSKAKSGLFEKYRDRSKKFYGDETVEKALARLITTREEFQDLVAQFQQSDRDDAEIKLLSALTEANPLLVTEADVDNLLMLACDFKFSIRSTAIKALGKVVERRQDLVGIKLVEVLVKKLEQNVVASTEIAKILGYVGKSHPAAVDGLLVQLKLRSQHLLTDQNQNLVGDGAGNYIKGSVERIKPLVEALGEAGQSRSDVLLLLQAWLSDTESGGMCTAAVEAIAKIKNAFEVTPALERDLLCKLEDKDWEVVKATCIALNKLSKCQETNQAVISILFAKIGGCDIAICKETIETLAGFVKSNPELIEAHAEIIDLLARILEKEDSIATGAALELLDAVSENRPAVICTLLGYVHNFYKQSVGHPYRCRSDAFKKLSFSLCSKLLAQGVPSEEAMFVISQDLALLERSLIVTSDQVIYGAQIYKIKGNESEKLAYIEQLITTVGAINQGERMRMNCQCGHSTGDSQVQVKLAAYNMQQIPSIVDACSVVEQHEWHLSLLKLSNHLKVPPSSSLMLLERRDVFGNMLICKLRFTNRAIDTCTFSVHPADIDSSLRKKLFGDMPYVEDKPRYFGITKQLPLEAGNRILAAIQSKADQESIAKVADVCAIELSRNWDEFLLQAVEYKKENLLALQQGDELHLVRQDSIRVTKQDDIQQVKVKVQSIEMSLEELQSKLANIDIADLEAVIAKEKLSQAEQQQIAQITADPYKLAFYQALRWQLNSVYLASSAISSNMVQNQSQGTLGQIGSLLDGLSAYTPLIGIGVSILGQILLGIDQTTQSDRVDCYAKLAVDSNEMAKLAEYIARKVILLDLPHDLQRSKQDQVLGHADGALSAVNGSMDLIASSLTDTAQALLQAGVVGIVAASYSTIKARMQFAGDDKHTDQSLSGYAQRFVLGPESDSPEAGQQGESDAQIVAQWIIESICSGKYSSTEGKVEEQIVLAVQKAFQKSVKPAAADQQHPPAEVPDRLLFASIKKSTSMTGKVHPEPAQERIAHAVLERCKLKMDAEDLPSHSERREQMFVKDLARALQPYDNMVSGVREDETVNKIAAFCHQRGLLQIKEGKFALGNEFSDATFFAGALDNLTAPVPKEVTVKKSGKGCVIA